MLERWSEYIGELFEDNRQGRPVISCCLDGPKILKSEIREALKRMKKNKAAGPDEIHLTALEEFGIDRVTEIVNEIHDSGEIPVDMTKSIFIALPKKPGITDCELHRTISLMSHMTKILMRIVMKRTKYRNRPEIGEEHMAFCRTLAREMPFLLSDSYQKERWKCKRYFYLLHRFR